MNPSRFEHVHASRPWWHPLAWSERTRWAVLMAVSLTIWGWFDVRLRGTVDPANLGLHKTDFTVYTEAGAAFFDGRDPYVVTNPRGWGYLYPPLFAILVAPLHALEPRAQVLVWFCLSGLMTWGCLSEGVRIARLVMPQAPDRGLFGPVAPWIGWTAVVAAGLPVLNCLQRGQVGIAKVYLLLLGLRLCLENESRVRQFLGGAVLALPIVLKITPAVPVVFLLVQQFLAACFSRERSPALRRAVLCSGGVATGLILYVLVVPSAFIGWQANQHHLGTWWHSVAVQAEHSTGDEFAGDSYSPRNQSFSNGVRRFGNWASYCFAGGHHDEGSPELGAPGEGLAMDSPLVDVLLAAARVAAGCALVVVAWRTARSHDALQLAAAFGLAGVSTLVISPIARAHYFVLLYPATLFLTAWLLREGRPRWAAWCGIASAVLPVTHYVALDVAGRVGLMGIGITIWYAVGCVALVRFGRSQQAADTLPFATAGGQPLPAMARRAA